MTVRVTRRGDGKGYLIVAVDGDDVEGVGRRFVAVHRLAAYAWDVLDGLDDDREVHHRDRAPDHNAEANFEALPPEEHGRVTARQQRRGSA